MKFLFFSSKQQFFADRLRLGANWDVSDAAQHSFCDLLVWTDERKLSCRVGQRSTAPTSVCVAQCLWHSFLRMCSAVFQLFRLWIQIFLLSYILWKKNLLKQFDNTVSYLTLVIRTTWRQNWKIITYMGKYLILFNITIDYRINDIT